MISGSITLRRTITTLPRLCQRIKQTGGVHHPRLVDIDLALILLCIFSKFCFLLSVFLRLHMLCVFLYWSFIP